MDPIVTPIITVGIGLAKATIELMRLRQENRLANENFYNQSQLAQMDHDFQLQLQEARHRHEILLESIRSRNPDPNITIVVDADKNGSIPLTRVGPTTNIPQHLNTEAELLCNKGFDVVLDPVNEGYALALFVREGLTLAFWLPQAYPHEPPLVFVIAPSMLEQIHFDTGAWEPDRNLIEVVDAIAQSY